MGQGQKPFKQLIHRMSSTKWLVFRLISLYPITMPKRTYQPKKKKRKRTHGYRKRNQTTGGKKTIKRRRLKGRKNLSA